MQEVVIRYVEPKNLIREAVEKIPENYSTQDNIYTVFYREIIQRNDDYAAVSEAVLNVFKSPYTNITIISGYLKVVKILIIV